MKGKIKYSRERIKELEYYDSDISEIVNGYFFFKSILAVSAFIATTMGVGFIVYNRDENIRKLIRPEPVIITMIIIVFLCFKVLNKLRNEDIYDYLNNIRKAKNRSEEHTSELKSQR